MVEERRVVAIAAIKRVAAIFLSISFFLPLSQCTWETVHPETKATHKTVEIIYAYSHHNWPSARAFAACAAFFWPFAFAVASLIWVDMNQKLTVATLEILLCIGSGFMLFLLTWGDTLRYGAYMAGGSIGAYFTAALTQLVAGARNRWGKPPLGPT